MKDERTKFEAWWNSTTYSTIEGHMRVIVESYAFEAWQARAALASQQKPVPAGLEPVAWMYDDGLYHPLLKPILSNTRKDSLAGWTETPLFAAPVITEQAMVRLIEVRKGLV